MSARMSSILRIRNSSLRRCGGSIMNRLSTAAATEVTAQQHLKETAASSSSSSSVRLNEHVSSSAGADGVPSDENSPSAASSSDSSRGGGSRAPSVFKFMFGTAITGALVATCCASYGYNTKEIENKLASMQNKAQSVPHETASAFDKFCSFLYSTSMTVPIKAVECYLDARRKIEDYVHGFAAPSSDKLLPDLAPQEQHVFTLVLDLNETLIYSDWKRERGWKTFKRPGVDAFLEQLAQYYEIVVYSDQLTMYVDPIIERLDQKGCIRYRLSRDATQYENGKHYRDLSKLNRDPAKVIYISGHALESCLQSENALEIKPWKLESDDTALLDLIPFLEYVARHHPADLRAVLASYKGLDVASEFRKRTLEHQRRIQEQKKQGPFWRRG